MTFAIIVHGGAGGWNRSAARKQEAIAACAQAAEAGRAILQQGGSAVDAVEAAVNILEDCPVLDAGRGSYPNAEGNVEMDALIMDGQDLTMGAIAAIQRVRHPISLARRVMLESGHNFLVGAGADAFADSIGFERCSVEELLVDDLHIDEMTVAAGGVRMEAIGDTVGAVAIDIHGNVAAATSTRRRRRLGSSRASTPSTSRAAAASGTATGSACRGSREGLAPGLPRPPARARLRAARGRGRAA